MIQVENRFYVLATSSLADDRTRVLKWGETFAVLNRLGDIESAGLGEQGLYYKGTRHLSQLALRMGDTVPQLLRSTVQDDNAFLTLDMMNPDVYREASLLLPRGSLHLFRSKFLWRDVCYDKLRLANFSMSPVETSVSIDFAADYADIFQVRGTKRRRTGDTLPPIVEEDCVILSYQGLDGELRSTRLKFNPRPSRISRDSVEFAVTLQPKEETAILVDIGCQHQSAKRVTVEYDQAIHEARASLERGRQRFCRVTTSNPRLNLWLSRSEADVHMMISGNPEGAYPYAGVPWFNTVFGRDGILTAMECLWAAPWIAKSVLRYLAETQATSIIPEQEAEPGKILHEMRHGEMANLKEVPFGRYYGTVDATPLFVMLAEAYLACSGEIPFIKEIWPNVLAALDWIDEFGDSDKDGFVEYRAKGDKGLVQQGWKDSHDSVFHRDGALANPPIALCEVQAYVYGAKKAAARMATRLGVPHLAQKFESDAETLRGKFEQQFWDEELGTYVLALDADKNPCRVKASNAGHCLWTGIASEECARRMALTLMADDLFCGWGVRTLSSGEVRYNPMSYHNGSVWPHDNAIIASGLARYGHKLETSRILSGLLQTSSFMELNRLPELICGFHQRSEHEGPTLYPVACSPQAWAAGSVYLILGSCLGVAVQAEQHSVEFTSPRLPDEVDWIEMTSFRVGSLAVDFRLRRDGEGLSVDVLRADAGATVNIRS